jgi:hypothetical protein
LLLVKLLVGKGAAPAVAAAAAGLARMCTGGGGSGMDRNLSIRCTAM